MRVPVAPHSLQYLALSVFNSSLSSRCVGMSCSFNLRSLVTDAIECFTCTYVVICISSFVKCLFSLWLLKKLDCLLLLSDRSSLYVLYVCHLSDTCFVNIFSWFMVYLFVFLMVYFLQADILHFDDIKFSVFNLWFMFSVSFLRYYIVFPLLAVTFPITFIWRTIHSPRVP